MTPDWKQDQAETSRLPRKGKESAQAMLAELANWLEHAAGFYSGHDQQEKFMNYARVVRAASAPAAVRTTALEPFLRAAKVMEFYTPESMPDMTFPRPECESKYADEPRCVTLTVSDFAALATPEEASTAAGEVVAWRAKNDFGHWFATTNKALAETWRNIEHIEVQPLYGAPPAAQTDGVRESVIEECAKLIESGAGMADLIDQDDLDQQAKYIRGLALTRPNGNTP